MHKLPKGSKIVVPLDTNIINLMVECKKLVDKHTSLIDVDPLEIPYSALSSHAKIEKFEAEKLDISKLVGFALYQSFISGDAIPFVSPTVLNEILNISEKKAEFKAECLRFISSFSVMPAIETDANGNISLAGQKEAEELAYKYCEPYDYTYFNKAGEVIKSHSDIGAMKWDTNPHITLIGDKTKRPQTDAYVVSYPSIFHLSILTLNSCDMIDDAYGDGNRKNGIKNINSQYLGTDFKSTPCPLHPSDLFWAIRAKNKTAGATTKSLLTPLDQKEFLKILAIKFGKLDLAFTDKVSSMLEILHVSIPEELTYQYSGDSEIDEEELSPT